MPFDIHENDKNKAMTEIVNKIRNCNLACYTHEYTNPLRTKGNRVISVDELKNGKPLVDDWRGQEILFISQAPSKQAWADNELSSMNNSFFKDLLFPKVYPEDDPSEAMKKWQKSVFWLHTANCYPGKGAGGRDNAPDLKCAEMYFDEIINTMKPKFIILMGMFATRYFTKNFRLSLDTKNRSPSLKSILDYQLRCKHPLLISSDDRTCQYNTIVFKHARDASLSQGEKFALELVIQTLTNKEKNSFIKPFSAESTKPVSPIIDTRTLSSKHTWLEEIISVLDTLGGDAKNEDIFNEIEKRDNMNLTPSWKNSVRKTIALHSSGTGSYKAGNPDIFYMVGNGHWGLK